MTGEGGLKRQCGRVSKKEEELRGVGGGTVERHELAGEGCGAGAGCVGWRDRVKCVGLWVRAICGRLGSRNSEGQWDADGVGGK